MIPYLIWLKQIRVWALQGPGPLEPGPISPNAQGYQGGNNLNLSHFDPKIENQS